MITLDDNIKCCNITWGVICLVGVWKHWIDQVSSGSFVYTFLLKKGKIWPKRDGLGFFGPCFQKKKKKKKKNRKRKRKKEIIIIIKKTRKHSLDVFRWLWQIVGYLCPQTFCTLVKKELGQKTKFLAKNLCEFPFRKKIILKQVVSKWLVLGYDSVFWFFFQYVMNQFIS